MPRYKQLKYWTDYMKLLFSDIGQQAAQGYYPQEKVTNEVTLTFC